MEGVTVSGGGGCLLREGPSRALLWAAGLAGTLAGRAGPHPCSCQAPWGLVKLKMSHLLLEGCLLGAATP